MIKRVVAVLALIAFVLVSVHLTAARAADDATIKGLKEKLVVANKILDMKKLATPFGHISVRIPGTDTFLISRSLAPAMVTIDDIVTCDLNGKIIAGKYTDTYSEWPIHSEIYKARKDVNSVVHVHPAYVVALSMDDITMMPYNDFVVRETASSGPEPLKMFRKRGTIDTVEWGKEISDLLGKNNAVILKGHGAVVIGTSIEQALAGADGLESVAELTWMAMAVGKIVPYTKEEGSKPPMKVIKKGLHSQDRIWAYYEYVAKQP